MKKKARYWIALIFGGLLFLGPPLRWAYLSIDFASNMEWLIQKLTGSQELPGIIKTIEAHPLPFELSIMAIGFGLLYWRGGAIPTGNDKKGKLEKPGVVAFFGTREELSKRYPLSQIFVSGNEIYAYFLSGEGIFSWHEDYIQYVKRLILPKPDGHYLQTIRTFPGNPYLRVVDQINTTTALAQKHNVEIRWFDDFIGMALLFCNPEGADGWVHVELHVPFANASERHTYRLEKARNGRDFEVLYKAFKKMWDESSQPPVIHGNATGSPPPSAEFTPMSEAARKIYEEARRNRSPLARQAEEMSGLSSKGQPVYGSADEILEFVATRLSENIDVYGIKPPSTVRERIDRNELKHRFVFSEGATKLEDRINDLNCYTDLVVKTEDFEEQFNFQSGFDRP